GIPENISSFFMQCLSFIMVDRILPIVVVIAMLMGIRARDIDWQTWTRRIVPVSFAWAILAYGIYLTAVSYRSAYFFVLSAVAMSAPFGWLADRALAVLEEKPRRAIVLAGVIACSVVAPVPVMKVYAEEKDALRAIRDAVQSAVWRAPNGPIHC